MAYKLDDGFKIVDDEYFKDGCGCDSPRCIDCELWIGDVTCTAWPMPGAKIGYKCFACKRDNEHGYSPGSPKYP